MNERALREQLSAALSGVIVLDKLAEDTLADDLFAVFVEIAKQITQDEINSFASQFEERLRDKVERADFETKLTDALRSRGL